MEMAAPQSPRRNHLEKGVRNLFSRTHDPRPTDQTAPTLAITILPFTEDRQEEVRSFNRRLRDGGVEIQFPDSHIPDWLPRTDNSTVHQEYFLAVDEDDVVRGGYILKTQDFFIDGQTRTIADLRLPLSEGIINPDYNFLGLQLVTNALARQPLLFALGMGGYSQALPQLLKAMRWKLGPVSFLFRVVHAGPFLKNIAALRTSKWRCMACDVAANAGLGWLALKFANAVQPGYRLPETVTCHEVDSFGNWVDDIWEAGRDEHMLTAVRSHSVLNALYPGDEKKFIRLRILRDERPIGWAVCLATPMSSHKQFGNMTVGTIVDGFSLPGDAPAVVCCARKALERRAVDVIVSNQSHDSWSSALSQCGFRQGPTNFLFAVSPKLARLLPAFPDAVATFHLNRGDGDGPIHL